MRHRGVRGEAWGTCDRCGFEHPLHMLTLQLGVLVCRDHRCYDDLDIMRRPQIIAEVLQRPEDEPERGMQIVQDAEEVFF